MKVTVLQENVSKALGVAQRFVATKGQLPILANILLATEKGRLKIASTNLELGIKYLIGAKVEKDGEITVPARALTEFVASLPKDKVELEVDQEKLKIVCGAYRAEFRGIGASEFPQMGEMVVKRWWEFEVGEFEKMVNQVVMAAATDEGRLVLTGVRWRMSKEGMELVATDGYRLSVKTLNRTKNAKLKMQNSEEKTLIIPARALMEVGQIGKSLGDDKLGVKVGEVKEGNQVMFDLGDVQVVARQLEGEFPDVKKVILEKAETVARVDVEELRAAVRAAAIFARDSANVLRWTVGKEGILIAANSPQIGENQVEVEAEVEGVGGKIAFNSRYVMELLGVMGTQRIRLEMTGGLKPGVFKPEGDESLVCLIMPVRVQEEG